MSFFEYGKEENSESSKSNNEDEDEDGWIEIKPKIKCNILKCKDCHPNNPGFTKESLANYRERNKYKKPYTGDKYCTNLKCVKCKNIIKKHNLWRQQYFINNPEEYKNYITKNKQKNQLVIDKNIVSKNGALSQNKNEQIKELNKNNLKFDINEYKTTSVIHDGNCGYRAILEIMGINEERCLDLKFFLA